MTLKNIDDKIIVELLANDAKSAIALILAKYGDALQGVIFGVVRSKTVAEEVLQDACIKVWRKATDYDADKGRLFTWLITIARNTAIDKTRSKEFRQAKKSNSLDSSVYNDIALSETMQISDVGLHRVLQQLNPEHVQLINLLYLKGYTQREAAEELNIPLGTVKSRVKIALRELRKLLSVPNSTVVVVVKEIIEHLSTFI